MIQISESVGFAGIDKKKFSAMIELGFGKILVPDYFEYTHPEFVSFAQNEKEYLGAVVVEAIPDTSAHYLDKIVVVPEFQGNGLAKLLLGEVAKHSKKLVWRAKKENPAVVQYEKNSSGSIDLSAELGYVFFYSGIEAGSAELSLPLAYAIAKKPTLLTMEDRFDEKNDRDRHLQKK